MAGRWTGVLTLVASSFQLMSCASDGAVRLARCVGEAADYLVQTNATEVSRECDLEIPSGSKVIAIPAEPLTSEEMYAAGLSVEDIRGIDYLALSDMPSERINVLPPKGTARPSRTGYQSRFVDTPELLVCETTSSIVTIRIRSENGRMVWRGLE